MKTFKVFKVTVKTELMTYNVTYVEESFADMLKSIQRDIGLETKWSIVSCRTMAETAL